MNKIKEIEKNIVDFIIKHYEIFLIIILILLSLLLRYTMLSYKSPDYTIFLKKWFNTLKDAGGFAALNLNIGDYNPPYVQILAFLTYIPIKSLFSIKIISIIFDYLLAFIGYKLIYNLCENKETKKQSAVIGLIALIFLPTLFINSALWAQCDIIYTFFCILSLYYLQKDKTTLSFVSLGIAFSFKLQAVFVLPAYLILYCKKRNFSILNLLWLPIMNFILSLPSIIMGKSIIDIFNVYVEQTSSYSKFLNLAFPNFYSLIDFNMDYFIKNVANIFGISIVIVIFAILLYLTLKSKKKLEMNNAILLTIISVLVCVYFLPHMHERYMFLADILCLIYAITYKKGILKSIIIELFSLNAYFIYFQGSSFIPEYICSIILLITLISYIKDYLSNMEILPKLEKCEKQA